MGRWPWSTAAIIVAQRDIVLSRSLSSLFLHNKNMKQRSEVVKTIVGLTHRLRIYVCILRCDHFALPPCFNESSEWGSSLRRCQHSHACTQFNEIIVGRLLHNIVEFHFTAVDLKTRCQFFSKRAIAVYAACDWGREPVWIDHDCASVRLKRQQIGIIH